jgi:site-specific DNA-methyltransferase (adenine-specific)
MRVENDGNVFHLGGCLEVLRAMASDSVDAVVTDPPYGLSFMGKKWDYDVPATEVWEECLRVLKPGGHLLAFAGTRTQHRMAVRIEDAGFEIRDMIAWVYGSGFPKSHNLKDDWQGWGTALKPALEPITVARKPLIGTVAENVLAHGTGAMNIDGCRVATNGERVPFFTTSGGQKFGVTDHRQQVRQAGTSDVGRWPANLIHDGGEFLGEQARFFYCAKASKRDRDEGLEHLPEVHRPNGNKWTDQDYCVIRGERPQSAESGPRRNTHPTVKPTDLMRYLCRLVTPPGGVVLDPFMGSGSTGKAAMREGFKFIGIEREQQYFDIACARVNNTQKEIF